MDSEVDVTSCSKYRGRKTCFFEADKPRMNAELRVMIAEL